VLDDSLQTCAFTQARGAIILTDTISEARLVDDDMKDVEVGKEGEMLVRGPTVFR
jgi:non-ribosomal peptide synthetase component E (peptide arylation enzyme)